MNKIIENFLNMHKKEYSIESWDNTKAFEHFINRCLINKYITERFDPQVIMTDDGEIGIDGIAICVNDKLVTTKEELESIHNQEHQLDIKFIFIQSKTSEKFESGEIGTFAYGVKNFFAPDTERANTNEKIENLISIKDKIYELSIDMKYAPVLELYYVSCGTWNDTTNLNYRINNEVKELKNTQNFSNVYFYSYDSERIVTAYKELKKKITKSITMEKKVTFPITKGVKQSFLGLVKCKEFIKILEDNDGNMLKNIFEDNVRDFQGYNTVNSEIEKTINDPEDQERFGILNNGITIVSKSINVVGDQINIYDYQIVNGCQTSYVLYDNRDKLSNQSYIMLKLIEVTDNDVLDRVIYTTNRQTEVKPEAFIATNRFHKRLQDYYDCIEPDYKLYYERRSKQFDLDDTVSKNKVVTLTTQIKSYLSMFLNEPHSTHRYYGELLNAYKNRIFLDTDDCEPYFCAAYFSYYIDEKIRIGKIDKRYKIYKFHIICAMRALIAGSTVVFGKRKQQIKICKLLWDVIKDPIKMDRYLKSAITCLDSALEACFDIDINYKYRSKEVTNSIINFANLCAKSDESKNYLKKGDIVHCSVISINPYAVDVSIKTDDSRNTGSIYISRFSKEYIDNLFDRVSLGDIFQAKIINDDFYENKWGWELSRIF